MAFPVNVDSTWVNPNTVSLDGGELRRADSAMFAGAGNTFGPVGGVVRHADNSLAVTVDASDNVTVQAGVVVIPGNAVTGTGVYRSALPAATTNALTARHATLPRIDLIVFRQMDTDVVGSHGAYTGRIEAIAGTPAASPTAPALPTMAVELARVTVPATGGGAASVDSSFRTYTAGIGGQLYVPTSARLPASAATWQKARALDTGVEYEWTGTAWRDLGASTYTGYTPTYTGITPRADTVIRYRRSGMTVYVQYYLVGTITGQVSFSLPYTAQGAVYVTGPPSMGLGSGWAYRFAAPIRGVAHPFLMSVNAVGFIDSGNNELSNTSYGGWTNSDSLRGTFHYEAAV